MDIEQVRSTLTNEIHATLPAELDGN